MTLLTLTDQEASTMVESILAQRQAMQTMLREFADRLLFAMSRQDWHGVELVRRDLELQRK